MTDKERIDCASIVQDLRDEADLCRSETADDIAGLLDDAASCIVAMKSQFNAVKSDLAAREAELADVRNELDAVLRDWNALVRAIGSPTNGAAIGYAANLKQRAEAAEDRDTVSRDALDYLYGLTPERVAQLRAAERELASVKAENSKLRSALEIVHFKQEPWQ